MNTTFGLRKDHYFIRLGVFLIAVVLIAGMAGCFYTSPFRNLEIRTWYDLDAIRGNLTRSYVLMNDLDSTTAGYEELAGPEGNEGETWMPIGTEGDPFTGAFDGQGYEIRDLFVDSGFSHLGVFGFVDEGGQIEDIGVVDALVVGYEVVGGLVGVCYGNVANSYFTGSVTGHDCDGAGGLVGVCYGTVTNSHSTGSVTGNESIGGLVGGNAAEGNVSNSYSTGGVTGTSRVGGLVGWNYEGTVGHSFWDIETSGQATSDGGMGKTSAEMKDITTFSGAGWNIIAVGLNETDPAHIWNIVDGVTYPFLSWQVI